MSRPEVSVTGRTRRALAWGLFGVLALGWALTSLLHRTAVFEATVGNVLVYLLPMLLAALSASALVFATRGAERRFWALLAAASGVLVTAEMYWAWYVVAIDPRGPQLPAPFEILQALAAILFVAMFVSMTTFGQAHLVTRVRGYLDASAAMIVVWVVIYLAWTLPLLRYVPRGGWIVAAIAAIYPVLGGTFLLISLTIIGGWKAERGRSWERLIAASLAIYGIGLCAFPTWYTQVLVEVGPLEPSWFSVVLGFGYYLLFMAIVYRATSGFNVVVEPWPIPRTRLRWLPVAYPVVIALALPFLGWAALTRGADSGGAPVVLSTFGLTAVLILRSWFSALERAHHRELAITDPVSGAYNHRYLHESLTDDLLRAATVREDMAVIILDIDEFKGINNAHGHEAGDALLRKLAEMIQSGFGPTTKVFRFGSDEFVAVVPGVDADLASEMTRTMHLRISREVKLAGTPVSFSTGIAMFPLHGADGEQLLSRALAAQQLAKMADADDVVVYDERIVGAVDPFERLARAQQRSRRATVRTLAAAVDARDTDTRNHSENVAELGAALAQVLGMSEQQRKTIELASRLHDIGKIGVSDGVLLKVGALDEEDRRQIEEHPVLGERILAPAQLEEILPAVRHHHERWDGTGYPDGLRGPQIPLEARVLSVCDSFEAMTATRSYREALSVSDALREINLMAGSQFDPEVAAAFSRMVTRLHGYAARDKAERLGQDPVVAEQRDSNLWDSI